MQTRKTAGELSFKASSDSTKYDPLELGHALTEDIMGELLKCAEIHDKVFDEPEYCLILTIAGDPLIKNLRRHKFSAWPYLPQPRPQQAVFLWNKIKQKLKFLWSMPDAKVMATISEMGYVDPKWRRTKGWCDAFYAGQFFQHIRKQHEIGMPSESEYIELHRESLEKACEQIRLDAYSEKIVQTTDQNVNPLIPESFDFSKIATYKVIDPDEAVPN